MEVLSQRPQTHQSFKKKLFYNPLVHRFYYSNLANALRNFNILRQWKLGMISTMTRSGTTYNREFFYFYDQLLRGKTPQEIFDHMVSVKMKLPAAQRGSYNTIGLDALFISHYSCPGFEEHYQGKYREAWNELNYYINPKLALRHVQRYNTTKLFDLAQNPSAKIVYFYRNPLDQAVSTHRVYSKVKNLIPILYRKDSQGNIIYSEGSPSIIKEVGEFIHSLGMDGYLKHFLTFKLMKALYPENILIRTYEDLVRDPKSTFLSILKHFEIDEAANQKSEIRNQKSEIRNHRGGSPVIE